MAFKFLHWRPKFKEYERGVRKGDLLYKRPRPSLNLRSARDWGKFLVCLLGGWFAVVLIGVIAWAVVFYVTGAHLLGMGTWGFGFGIVWVVYCVLQLIHSLRFVRRAGLCDVEFIPLDKAEKLGRRILAMPEDFPDVDYNILFSRYIWADVECQPYRDVTDWVERISTAQSGGEPVSTGGGVGEKIGSAIRQGYLRATMEEIAEIGGGIPSTREIVWILQTELVPRYREELGERLMSLYLVFLATQPPVLPYNESTTKSDMREVAAASDTKEVLDYLNQFTRKK